MWDDLARRASRAVAAAASIGADDAGLLAPTALEGRGGSSLRAASASLRTRSRTNLAPSSSSAPGAASSSKLPSADHHHHHHHHPYAGVPLEDGGAGGGGGDAEGGAAAAAAASAASPASPAPEGAGAGAAPTAAPATTAVVERALAKTTRALMPVILAIVGLNYLDRTALAFCGPALSHDLELTPADFGLASGAFFLGYSAFQLPSNLVVMRIGARRWLPVLMVAWGAAAAAFAAIRTPAQLVGLRLVLGAAEAGAFPCIWYALSLFYPRERLTRPYATMLVAVAVSQVLAAPTAAALLSMDGWMGLRGWQIVFLAEGIPAILLGAALPWLLPDGPQDAAFLSAGERAALVAAVERSAAQGDALMTARSSGGGGEDDDDGNGGAGALPTRAPSSPPQQQQQPPHPPSGALALIRATAARPEVWVLAFANILKDMAAFGALFFTPLIVASLIGGGGGGGGGGAGGEGAPAPAPAAPTPPPPAAAAATGVLPVLLTAVPFGAAAASTYWWSGLAQERGDPAYHAALPFLLGGVLFALYPFWHWLVQSPPLLAMASLTAGLVGAFCGGPLIVVLVTAAAPPEATAVALPLFNSVGMVGGFLGPVLLGWIVQRTGGLYDAGASAMGAALLGSGAVLWALRAVKLRRLHSSAGGGGGGGGGGAAAAIEFVPLKTGSK
jgi:MFS family permease